MQSRLLLSKPRVALARPQPKSKIVRARLIVRASVDADLDDARGAIAVGLNLYKDGKYEDALKVFEKALTLPGTGLKRFRDKPREISAGEKQAALYNIACCFSKMQDARSALITLGTCLDAGYEDYQQIYSDPDLEFVRQDERFKNVMSKFDRASSGGGGIWGFIQYQLDPKNSAIYRSMNKK